MTVNYHATLNSKIIPWIKSETTAGYVAGSSVDVGLGARAILLGNFMEDSERRPDIVVANFLGGNLSFVEGTGNGLNATPSNAQFGVAQSISLAGADGAVQPWALASGWLDGVDHLDLAVADKGGGRVIIMAGNGDGTFDYKRTLTTAGNPVAVVVGDFDRNGRDDVAVVSDVSNTLKIFLKSYDPNGPGTFPTTASSSYTYTTGTQPSGLTVCDVNMDGRVDIIVTSRGQSKLQVFRGLGNGLFQSTSQDFTTASQPVAVVSIQINNDAKPDLIAICASGNISRLMNNQSAIPEVVSFALPNKKNSNLSQRPNDNDYEPTVAINRANPENIVAFCTALPGLLKATSFTGGRTWNAPVTVFSRDCPGQHWVADESAAFDRFGNLYVTYVDSNSKDTILNHSIDGGLSFTADITIIAGYGEQPTVVVGPEVLGGAKEAVWVVTGSTADNSAVFVAHSTGLANLQASACPTTIPPSIFCPPAVNGVQSYNAMSPTFSFGDQYADLTVDELGGLLGSFQNSPPASSPVGLLVVRDPDPFTGANFQQIEGARLPRLGARTAEYGPVLPASKATPAEETGIACDRSHGFFRGRLYQIFMDTVPGVFSQQSGGYRGEETVDCDIFCRYSDNKGDSWSDLVRVNDDSGGFSQFLPRIAVDQTSGHVAISYCDASLDPNNTKIVLRLALSRDGGKTFCRL